MNDGEIHHEESRETTHGIGPDHINTTSVVFSDGNITSECSGGQSTRSPANESGPSRGSNANEAGPSRGSNANEAGPSRGSNANGRRRNPPRKSRETTHGIGPGGQSARSPANEAGPSRGSN
eukprot:63321_1